MMCLTRQAAVNTPTLFSPEHTSLQTARHRSNNMLPATHLPVHRVEGHTHTHTGRTPDRPTALVFIKPQTGKSPARVTLLYAWRIPGTAQHKPENHRQTPRIHPPHPLPRQHPKMHPAWAQQPPTPRAPNPPRCCSSAAAWAHARGASAAVLLVLLPLKLHHHAGSLARASRSVAASSARLLTVLC